MEVIYVTHPMKRINTDEHVMAIGFFDGIHLGHQELLNRARQLARNNDVLFTAMTFSPHPDEVIKGDKERKYLTPLEQKVEKMAEFGVDKLFVVTFNKTFASLSPTDFINEYIIGTNTKHVVVGYDFTFGFKAKGNTEFLYTESNKHGFGLSVVPKKTFMGKKISSSLLRELLQDGDVDAIPYHLGEPYSVKVRVVQQIWPGIVKVQVADNFLLPKKGSYHVEIVNGNRIIIGQFDRDSYTDELIITGLNDCIVKEVSIAFLSMVASARTVSS
ncbi:FAD synthetase family protein [Virgibacillus kekensis]|uniref:Riboflavin biosynthesis protein n=1 Tax=Virgibacillus kekensis TaxID=202261 RepID=A0ABV9DHW9_9BACI